MVLPMPARTAFDAATVLLCALPIQFAEAIAVAITTAITPSTSLTLPQHSC